MAERFEGCNSPTRLQRVMSLAFLSDEEVRQFAEEALQDDVAPKLLRQLGRQELVLLLSAQVKARAEARRASLCVDDLAAVCSYVESLQRQSIERAAVRGHQRVRSTSPSKPRQLRFEGAFDPRCGPRDDCRPDSTEEARLRSRRWMP